MNQRGKGGAEKLNGQKRGDLGLECMIRGKNKFKIKTNASIR